LGILSRRVEHALDVPIERPHEQLSSAAGGVTKKSTRLRPAFSDRSYDSEARAATLRGCWRRCFKDHSGNVVVAPDSFANVNGLEFVKAEFELVRQLLSFESKLDTSTSTGEIVNGAMVNGRTLNQYPRRVINLDAL
jgi:hypothetical protein